MFVGAVQRGLSEGRTYCGIWAMVPRVEALEADEGQHFLLSASCPSMMGPALLSHTTLPSTMA